MSERVWFVRTTKGRRGKCQNIICGRQIGAILKEGGAFRGDPIPVEGRKGGRSSDCFRGGNGINIIRVVCRKREFGKQKGVFKNHRRSRNGGHASYPSELKLRKGKGGGARKGSDVKRIKRGLRGILTERENQLQSKGKFRGPKNLSGAKALKRDSKVKEEKRRKKNFLKSDCTK